jgi:hypothetical protein
MLGEFLAKLSVALSLILGNGFLGQTPKWIDERSREAGTALVYA